MSFSKSKYALFVSIPFVGHINPLLHQAGELLRRGWQVSLASVGEVKEYVESTPWSDQGVRFINLGSASHLYGNYTQLFQQLSQEKSFWKSSFQIVDSIWLLWPLLFDSLSEHVKRNRPDILIADFVTRAVLDVAEAERIPAIVNNPCLLTTISITYLPPAYHVPSPFLGHSIHHLPWHTRWSYPLLRWLGGKISDATFGRKLNQLRASRGLPKLSLDQAWAQHIVMVNGAFGLEYPRPIPSNVVMVGPMLPEIVEALPQEVDEWLNDGPIVIYANLGTVSLASADLIERMYTAFAHASFRVWWILKPQLQELLPDSPAPHIRIDSWGPSLPAVLRHPKIGVFVSHCGINSIHESLATGTPIVGIPMFADQFDMAMRIKDAGVGLFLDKLTFTSDELRNTIERVLYDNTFLAPMASLQKSFIEAGGVARAADLIEQEAARSTGVTEQPRA